MRSSRPRSAARRTMPIRPSRYRSSRGGCRLRSPPPICAIIWRICCRVPWPAPATACSARAWAAAHSMRSTSPAGRARCALFSAHCRPSSTAWSWWSATCSAAWPRAWRTAAVDSLRNRRACARFRR